MDWTAHFDVYTYLDDELGIARVAHGGSGEEYICDCPFCGKRMKFYMNAEKAAFVCYSCEESGSLPHLIMELENLTYRQAVAKIVKAAGARLSSSLDAVREKQKKRRRRRERKRQVSKPSSHAGMAVLPEEYVPVWDENTGEKLRVAYLEETRGFTIETSRTFKLGVCVEGDYRGRVIFPVIEHGNIVTFQARAMGKWEPKYMNPGGINKGDYIYGHDLVLGQEEAVIVEGPTDVVSCFQKGIMVCAPLGKTITRKQIRKLRAGGTKRLCLLLDGEAIKDAIKAAALAIEVMDVTIARLPSGQDPDDTPATRIRVALAEAKPPTTRELRDARGSL